MITVIKRDASAEAFDKNKIIKAVTSAMEDCGCVKENIACKIAEEIENELNNTSYDVQIDITQIETKVFEKLISHRQRLAAKAYEGYRSIREFQRNIDNTTDNELLSLLNDSNDYWKTENSNKNAALVTTQRDYMAGIVSRDLTERFLLPPDILQAHKEGIIHFHDEDYFAQSSLHNCDLINLEDMLQNGTMINGVKIDKPHRFLTACTIATQIITAVTSSQFGGASITLTHLAPFVTDSYTYYLNKYRSRGVRKHKAEKYAKEDTLKEIKDGVQTFNYQINSMQTTNGQAPFITVFMYLGETEKYKNELALVVEEFLNQRILGMKNEKGVYVTQAFPKLIYVLEEDNIVENSKYYYLTKLSAQCTAKRMVPDYISEKVIKELKAGNCFPCMGCRSFLTPYIDKNGKYKFYGRFNKGVVTINLPDVALSANGDIDEFWKIFDKRLELCRRALYLRYLKLKGTSSNVAPILWQDGALARLAKDETIDELLIGGYSTLSLGYAGLYECVVCLTHQKYVEPEAKKLGLQIMQYMNDKCNEWNEIENLGYSIYGTPIESTTYKFAKCLKERFGDDVFIKIDGKDRNYITNSYHIPVFQNIDAFSKLKFESEFQALSTGGAISYVEVPNMQNNIPAVLQVMKYIYENIMYAELNTKSDYCQACGYNGEIQIVENKHGKLIWRCPKCGNEDQDKMNVARRTCGYIGVNFWNQGRTQEIKERVLHL